MDGGLGGGEGGGGGGGEEGGGGFSLGGIMKMFGALGAPGGEDAVASKAAATGQEPPPLPPPVGAASGTGIPDFPAPGTAGLIQPGAFAGVLDPSQGQTQQPTFGAQNIPIVPQNDLSTPADPSLGGSGPAAQEEAPFAGLTAQQAELLKSLSKREPLEPAPGRGRLTGPSGSIAPGTQFAPSGGGNRRLSLAQILGR